MNKQSNQNPHIKPKGATGRTPCPECKQRAYFWHLPTCKMQDR